MFIKRISTSLLFLFTLFLTTYASADTESAEKTIYNFYNSYFSDLNKKDNASSIELPYSTSFNKLISHNKELCNSFPDEICGWGADGDVYLDAQDYDEKLSIENSQFKINESPSNTINVSFYLFPSEKSAQDNQRHISFKMVYEHNKWVVDDIIYNRDTSSREQINNENKLRNDELSKRKSE
jgi:hypothetical protein